MSRGTEGYRDNGVSRKFCVPGLLRLRASAHILTTRGDHVCVREARPVACVRCVYAFESLAFGRLAETGEDTAICVAGRKSAGSAAQCEVCIVLVGMFVLAQAVVCDCKGSMRVPSRYSVCAAWLGSRSTGSDTESLASAMTLFPSVPCLVATRLHTNTEQPKARSEEEREAGRGKRRPMCSCIVGVGEGGYAKGRKPGQADCRAPKRARRTKHHPCVLGGSGTANTTLDIRCMRQLIWTMCCTRWAVPRKNGVARSISFLMCSPAGAQESCEPADSERRRWRRAQSILPRA